MTAAEALAWEVWRRALERAGWRRALERAGWRVVAAAWSPREDTDDEAAGTRRR